MKCLIVDDEPLARQLLERYIAGINGLTLVKSAENSIDAFTVIQNRPVDLIFLDIQMPQITGIELLRSLKQRPRVILTTAYREYAFEAYDLDVVDYLLKPISFDRFLRSISKIYQLRQPIALTEEVLPGVQSFDGAYIYVKEDREMIKVFLKDILYIESLRDYVRIKTEQRQIITYQKISYLEQKLPESKFVRIHRSFIVACDHVSSFTVHSVRVGGLEIPIGRNYKNSTLKVLHRDNVLQ
jgi:DNA-binding LytR/AlgR family response regulator